MAYCPITGDAYKIALRAANYDRAQARLKELRELRILKREAQRRYLNDRCISDNTVIPESASAGDMRMDTDGSPETQENVVDHTGEEVNKLHTGKNELPSQPSGMETFNIQDFFARPFTIFDDVITSATDIPGTGQFNKKLPIWEMWSSSPTIRAKLSNYGFFKGTLKLRIAISGTPFHYGMVLASYQPFPAANENLTSYDHMIAETYIQGNYRAGVPYKAYLSQAPGAVTIDIKKNEPVDMEIPFISTKRMFRLWNSDPDVVIDNSVPFDDFAEAGELRLTLLNPLRVANQDTEAKVSINIYAWMEDVELGCITMTDIDITAQSFTVGGDEFHTDGPVSKVASAVSDVGNMLADAPVIGTLAKTTANIFKKGAQVAAIFGFSKPQILDKPTVVHRKLFGNGANLSGSESAYKISCDPKQELTIDPSIGGMAGEDELSIARMASRPSWITAFIWGAGDTPLNAPIWAARIHPFWATGFQNSDGFTMTQGTPLAYVAAPFTYWRGTIKVRLQIVCSRFHRGKLMVRYEPNPAAGPSATTKFADMNQMCTQIIDIQDVQDIEFEIQWGQARDWCPVPDQFYSMGYLAGACQLDDATPPKTNPLNDENPFDSPPWDTSNGFMEIRVLNELIQPHADAPVEVNVYVSCDDLQVAVPSSYGMPISRHLISAESADIPDVSMNTVKRVVLNPTGGNFSNIHVLNFGEKILSFRSLMKRFVTSSAIKGNDSNTSRMGFYWLQGPHFPCPSSDMGPDPRDIDGANPYHPFDYLRYAFMGMRGSMRHRVIYDVDKSQNPPSSYAVVGWAHAFLPEDGKRLTTGVESTMNPDDMLGVGTLEYSIDGTIAFHTNTASGMEFETPYYSLNLFQFSFNRNEASSDVFPSRYYGEGYYPYYNADWHLANATGPALDGTNNWVYYHSTAIGEDFQFLRFQGVPMYSNKYTTTVENGVPTAFSTTFPAKWTHNREEKLAKFALSGESTSEATVTYDLSGTFTEFRDYIVTGAWFPYAHAGTHWHSVAANFANLVTETYDIDGINGTFRIQSDPSTTYIIVAWDNEARTWGANIEP